MRFLLMTAIALLLASGRSRNVSYLGNYDADGLLRPPDSVRCDRHGWCMAEISTDSGLSRCNIYWHEDLDSFIPIVDCQSRLPPFMVFRCLNEMLPSLCRSILEQPVGF